MMEKSAIKLSLSDKIYYYNCNVNEPGKLDIEQMYKEEKFIVFRTNIGSHIPKFSMDPLLKAGFEYFEENSPYRYFTNELRMLKSLKESLDAEKKIRIENDRIFNGKVELVESMMEGLKKCS